MAIYNIYCDGDNSFMVLEYLKVFLSQLEYQHYKLKKWEIATIIAKVTVTLHMQIPKLRIPKS